jgi:hypothetical protein
VSEQHDPNHNAAQTDSGHANREPSYLRWVFLSGGIAAIGLLVTSIYWPNLTERTKFFTGNLLNLVIALAVIAQVLIYRKQRDIMRQQWQSMQGQLSAMRTQSGHLEGQLTAMAENLVLEQAKTDPRLRVSKIRIENFGAGKTPIFIVTIANSGLIDATGVGLHIGIALGTDKEFNWIAPQTVIIPARWQESYPVNSGMLPDEKLIQSLTDGSVPIEVRVRLKYWPRGDVEFCYKYFPWPRGSERPDDIPQFFDCDFRANVNVVVHVKGIEMKLTGFAPTMIYGKAPTAEDEKKGGNEDDGQNDKANPN